MAAHPSFSGHATAMESPRLRGDGWRSIADGPFTAVQRSMHNPEHDGEIVGSFLKREFSISCLC